jgi:ferric-dicitrate binding protein FerR (iron transport regulator)
MSTPPDLWHAAMTARLYDELSEAVCGRLDDHLAEAPDERAHMAALFETTQMLRALPIPAPSQDLADKLLDRIMPETAADTSPVPENPPVAEIALVHGTVKRCSERGAPWREVRVLDTVAEGEALEIGPGARALLRLPDKSELWVNAETLLHFGRRAAQTFVSIVRGEVLALVAEQRRALSIATPAGTVSVLGTAFDTDVSRDGRTRVSVLDGQVEFKTRAGRATVGAHRRVEAGRGERPSRVKRLLKREVKRLAGWTAPLRAASQSAERIHIRRNGREGTMRSINWLIGIVIIGGLGFIGYNLFFKSEPPRPDFSQATVQETFTPVSTGAAAPAPPAPGATGPGAVAASPEAADGAVTLWLDQNAGLRWVETMSMANTMRVTEGSSPTPQDIVQQMTLITDCNVAENTPEGHARVERVVRDASMDFTVNGQRVDLAQMGQANPLDQLRGKSMSVTVDQYGRVVDADVGDLGGVFQGANTEEMQKFMQSLTAGVPDRPVRVGDQWSREVRLPGSESALARCTSTLDRIETVGDQRVAVIRQEAQLDLPTPMPPIVQDVPGSNGVRAETTIRRMQMWINMEQRLLIETGRWAGEQGGMSMAISVHTRVVPPRGQPRETDADVQGNMQLQNQYDYSS